jgi:hypothetical protein
VREPSLRALVGILLVLSQLSLIVLTLVPWGRRRFLFEEARTTLELVTPVFVVYTTAIFKYVYAKRFAARTQGRRISFTFTFLSCLVPVVFVGALVATILTKAAGAVFTDMEEFKTTIEIIQTSFAVYLRMTISTLFGTSIEK